MTTAVQHNDELGMRDKFKIFAKKYRLDSHHGIERFGAIMLVIIVTGSILFGGGIYSGYRAGQADLDHTALYTPEFTTSRTAQKGQVTGLYTNPDRTRAMVVMKFSNPDQMSSNAADYYVYGSGMSDGPNSKAGPMAQPTTGSVYSFGSTGFLAVVLEAPRGFSKQVVNLTVRARKELAESKSENNAGASADKSKTSGDATSTFEKFDQWRVVINPGAEGVTTTDALDGSGTEGVDVRRMYTHTINIDAERELRGELNDKLSDMKSQLDRIASVEDAMATTPVNIGGDRNVHMVPPTLPDTMRGDRIEGMSSVQLREALGTTPASRIPGIAEKTPMARYLDTLPNGALPNTYKLDSAHPVDGGVNFDWRSGSVFDGYFKDLTGAGQSPSDYLSSLTTVPLNRFVARSMKWPLSNGQVLGDRDATDSSMRALNDLRNRATQAYQGFFDAKASYQRDGLWKLLSMERDVGLVVDATTVATGDDAVEFRM